MRFSRLLVLAAALLPLGIGRAQTINASLAGAIKDATGAAVAGAKVRIAHAATNVATEVASNTDGGFVAPSLPAGVYNVTVAAPGFKTAVRNNVTLQVSEEARLDITLEVGTVTESVDVSAQADVIDATTSSVGDVVDSTAMEELPLDQRNPYSLVFLVPGVQGSVGLTYNSNNISANGGRPGSGEVLIDGAASSPPGAVPINVLSIFPSVDALQEFRVQTSSYSAEFGRAGAGIVNMIFKSGTNQMHGTAFEFLRNSDLDANSFFNNLNGRPVASYKRNQFGFTLGGPVVIPRIYNGRNKTFFFIDYEGLRQGQPASNQDTVPTALQRSGDFSKTLAQNGQPVIIYDPLTTTQSGTSYVRSPFPGNVVPAQRMDPVGRNVMKYFPQPNAAGNQFTGINNFYMSGVAVVQTDLGDIRMDQYLGDKDRFFARFSRRTYQQPEQIGTYPSDLQIVSQNNALNQIATSLSADYTRTWSPTLLSDLRLSFARTLRTVTPAGFGFNPTQLGLPSYIAANAQVPDFPGFSPANFMSLGDGGQNFVIDSFQTYNVLFSTSKIHGNHLFKFGWEGRMLQVFTDETNAADGNFSFAVTITQGPDPTKATNTGGNGLASMLLGVGSGSMIQNYKISDTTSFYYAGYFADDWKISSKLTLNLGVRYEVQAPRTERHNRMNYFDPYVPSPLAGPAGIPGLRGGLVFVGQNGLGPRQFPTNWNNVAPRLGFAYQVARKTVLRGGGGIFFAPSPTKAGGVIGNFGYATTTTYTGSSDGLTPQVYLSNPFPTGLVPPTGNSLGLMSEVGQAVTEPLNNSPSTYTENWSFGIQRELPGAILADATYVGNHGVQLISGAEGNNANLNQLTVNQIVQGAALLTQVPNPFYGLITTGTLATKTVPQYYLSRQFPQFTSVNILYPQGANSFYNSLQVKLVKRFRSGLDFMLSYTNQKLIDDYSQIENLGQNANTENMYCRRCERAVSANDISQVFVYSGVYRMPFGRGHKFGAGWNRSVDSLLGGWQISGILRFQTGFPLNILNGNNNTLGSTNAGNPSQRPNNNGHSANLTGDIEARLSRYLDTSVFSSPPNYTFGNTSRLLPDVRGPGTRTMDLALSKNFRIRERLRAQFRGEAFNASNTVKFGLPNTSRNSNQFGVISGQSNSPRQVQVGLKLLF